MVFNKIILSNT